MNTQINFSVARPIDNLGRIVIPKEMRTVLGWKETDQVFIGIQDGTVYMRKYNSICPVCRNPFESKKELDVCGDCISRLVGGAKD